MYMWYSSYVHHVESSSIFPTESGREGGRENMKVGGRMEEWENGRVGGREGDKQKGKEEGQEGREREVCQ